MNKNIRLTLTGHQQDESGETLVTETRTQAEAYEKEGVLYLFFEECSQDTRSVTKNRIKLKKHLMELTKRGEINTRMVFEPGREYLTDYATPYGSLKLEIATQAMDIHIEENRLHIRIDYILSAQGAVLSRCQLTLLAE